MSKTDLKIKNGIVIDGTGKEPYIGDILVRGGKIIYAGPGIDGDAAEEIDCEGSLTVAPGFIDTHSHGDFPIFFDSSNQNKLCQGVTSEICGNCGISVSPASEKHLNSLRVYTGGSNDLISDEKWMRMRSFKGFLNEVSKLKLGLNEGFFVGHGTIRASVMGMDGRRPDDKELEEMKSLVAQSMEAGAYGMSSGLIYPPGVFSDIDELIELCKVVKQYGGIYATHMRNESFLLEEGVKEALDISRASGVKLLISHHKAVGRENFGKTEKTLSMIDEAVKEGLDIRLDQYPYTACSTSLKSMIPPKYHDGGTRKMVERLKDPEIRKQIEADIYSDDISWDNMYKEAGFENILVLAGENTPDAIGRNIHEYAELSGQSDIDALFEILIKNNGTPYCVEFAMGEDDIERVMKYPLTMVGSDSSSVAGDLRFHPRTTGTFPRVLGRYVRERKVITLPEAIRKMTSMPAEFFLLKDKGYLKEGYDADITIFDAERIIDGSDFINPKIRPVGINYIIVSGKIAVKDNELTGAYAGKVLKYK